MKKLIKLCINPENVMKNDELTTLRGGYGESYCSCRDSEDNKICSGWVL